MKQNNMLAISRNYDLERFYPSIGLHRVTIIISKANCKIIIC